jgi:hypothetical protein
VHVPGALPRGLILDKKTGRIHGRTSAAKGNYSFTAIASDGAGGKGEAEISISVIEPAAVAAVPANGGKSLPVAPAEGKMGYGVAPPSVTPPAPPAAAPQQCKAFDLATYYDVKSADLTWSGSLDANGTVEIRGKDSTVGRVRGDVLHKGVPVHVTLSPDTVHIGRGPSASNCWDSTLVLQNSGGPLTSITIKWAVFQP